MDLADVWMIDARRDSGLAPELCARPLVIGQRRHHLQRDCALEALIARGVHDAHAAFTQLALDRVMADAGGQVPAILRDRRARRAMRGRRRGLEPLIERAQPSTWWVID